MQYRKSGGSYIQRSRAPGSLSRTHTSKTFQCWKSEKQGPSVWLECDGKSQWHQVGK